MHCHFRLRCNDFYENFVWGLDFLKLEIDFFLLMSKNVAFKIICVPKGIQRQDWTCLYHISLFCNRKNYLKGQCFNPFEEFCTNVKFFDSFVLSFEWITSLVYVKIRQTCRLYTCRLVNYQCDFFVEDLITRYLIKITCNTFCNFPSMKIQVLRD